MVIEYRDKILSVVKARGYALPSDIVKELKTDSLISSAMLSEMVARRMLKISFLKIGSSPVYYDGSNPGILEKFVDTLKGPERDVIALLKSSRILRDTALSPLHRVALRAVKDFAVPLDVTIGGVKEVFWRWFLLSDADAETLIRELLEPPKIQESTPQPEKLSELPKKKPSKTVRKLRKSLTVQDFVPSESSPSQPVAPPMPVAAPSGSFVDVAKKFFSSQSVEVVEWLESKNEKEFDCIVRIPSPVGSMLLFCRGKDKKKIIDSDISAAVAEGQFRQLPVLFLTTGVLGKGVDVLLGKKFKGVTFKKL